jgi:AcrR family transcriptional regulator
MNQDSTSILAPPATARGRRTRQRLLDAAETVFGRVGYEAASIADLTREAGVALGTFYVYFPDKKTLFVEVVDSLGARLRHQLASAVADQPSRLAVERAGLEAFFAFARQHKLLYRVVRQAEFVDQGCYRRYYKKVGEPYARGLADAMKSGELRRVDPEALAYCLMGLTDFLGMRYVLWGNGRGARRAIETAMSLLRHGIAAKADASQAPARRRGSRPSR